MIRLRTIVFIIVTWKANRVNGEKSWYAALLKRAIGPKGRGPGRGQKPLSRFEEWLLKDILNELRWAQRVQYVNEQVEWRLAMERGCILPRLLVEEEEKETEGWLGGEALVGFLV